jgi:mono/diheme cytochrome c family protein
MKKRTLLLSIPVAGIAVAATCGWMTIRRGFSARDNPSAMEAYLARTARKLSIPASERDAKNPFTPTPEVLSEARAHFADHCATCHGNDGSGKTEIGQNLYPKVPDIRQSETQNLTDGQIYSIIHNGIRLTGMPAWGGPGKDDDSWKLVLFIRHRPQMNPQEMKQMEPFNPKSANDRSEEEDEQHFLNEGKVPETNKTMHHRSFTRSIDSYCPLHISCDRCSPGTFAFSERKEADEFVAQNGGVLRNLPEVLAEAQQQ